MHVSPTAVTLALALSTGTAAPGRSEEATLAPMAATRFCMDHAEECRAVGREAPPVALDHRTEAVIESVNRQVNAEITPVIEPVGGAQIERWEIAPATGDCNDFAVTKRHRLLTHGIPASNLILAAVKTPTGEDHLVLMVRSDRGDLVLDNLNEQIRRLDATGYKIEKRQDARDPKLWVAAR